MYKKYEKILNNNPNFVSFAYTLAKRRDASHYFTNGLQSYR